MTLRGTTTDSFCRAVRTLGANLLKEAALDRYGYWTIEVEGIVLEEELRRRVEQAGLRDVEVSR